MHKHFFFPRPKLMNLRKELLEIEANYVESLRNGIENYMNVFNKKVQLKAFENLQLKIFGNILDIYNFHKDRLLPALLACDENDLVSIAETFTDFLYHNHFYMYVLYGIDREINAQLCNLNISFWNVRMQLSCGFDPLHYLI